MVRPLFDTTILIGFLGGVGATPDFHGARARAHGFMRRASISGH